MPVTSRWLDDPPPPQTGLALRILAGVVLTLIAVLVVRVIVLALIPQAPPSIAATAAPVAPAEAATTAPAPAALPAPARPGPTPTPTAAAPAEPTIGEACPPAITPPAGARVGWLARAAGCPNIALANLDGVRQWVRRDRLSDDVYNQLPEVEP